MGLPAAISRTQTRVRTFAATLVPGAWVLGGGWDHTLWPDKQLPNRADIDAAYHAKYDRYGPLIVRSVTGPDAHQVTVRPVPQPQER